MEDNMRVLENLIPKKVFFYFEEICKIPHGSGNTKAISEYCYNFAKERNLQVIRDEYDNVIIKKSGTKGYENSNPVIIQGHLDMVCVKEENIDKDLSIDPVDLMCDGSYIYAKGTTLGGDNGIAVAYALALLDDDKIEHPPLEIVLTSDEEIGLIGASKLDTSYLEGTTMINLDSEIEGAFTVGCAGGVNVYSKLIVSKEEKQGTFYTVDIRGLEGGHSGVEIHKKRGNANVIAGKLLYLISKNHKINLADIKGGTKDNAIPVSNSFVIHCENNIIDEIREFSEEIKKEYENTDSGMIIDVNSISDKRYVFDESSTVKVIEYLYNHKNGVIEMSRLVNGLVETSLNIGIVYCEKNSFHLCASLRSSVDAKKKQLMDEVKNHALKYGGNVITDGEYPGWEVKEVSRIREIMSEVYENQMGKKPVIEAIHAGLECGIFAGKIDNLDCISIGPDMYDVHTTSEKLSIESTKRTWDLITEVLKRMK